MRHLPIFRGPPPSPVAEAPALALDAGCRRCPNAGKTPETTCLPADGDPGGLLVVDSFPTRNDAAMRRPLASAAAAQVRRLVQQHARGPVAYDAALRCAPTGDTSTLKLAGAVEKCRGYLHQTIREVRPTRILALGGPAIYALTGKVVPPQTTRRGFAWVPFEHGLVPVFFVISPLAAARNRFLAKWLSEDLEWALTTAVPVGPPEADAQAHLVETADDARQALAAVSGARWTAVDAEWAGRPYDLDFQLLSVALTPAPRLTATGAPDLDDPASSSAYVWPSQGCSPEAWRVLAEWLRDPKAKKVGSYFKSDTVAFHAALGVWTRGVAFDTRLLRRLMDVEASGRLADMAHLVGRGGHKDELQEALSKAVGAAKREARKGPGLLPARLPATVRPTYLPKLLAGAENERYGFAFVDPDLLCRYNAADTTTTAKVGALLESWLAAEPAGMQNVARKVVTPAGDAYARIESWGMGVDRGALEQFRAYLDLQLAEVAERFRPYGYSPEAPDTSKWNPNSNADVGRLLFTDLKLPSVRTTDSGADSTDADALEALADKHPAVRDLLMWRKLQKMRGTYAVGLAEHVRDDGRIHPSIHPDGARTGRTSSSDPNLQNIPSVEAKDAEQAKMARMLRDCFAPAPGHVLVEFDYSQLELRVAADLSGDPEMIAIFQRGEDYHLRTAKMLSQTLWNITPEEVTDVHRREVKGVNFALLYDDDPYGIAFRIGADVKQAERVRDAIFGCFPVLARWIKERVRETAGTGSAWTWWGGHPARRRPLVAVAEDEKSSAYKTARRGSWNGPIQGTGNEYLVASAIETVDWLLGDGVPAKLLVTIHDSMLLEVRRDALDEVFERVPQIMCAHPTKSGVPLAADAKAGLTWGDMKKWKKGAPCPV